MTAFFEDTSTELLNEWSNSFQTKTKDFKVSSVIDISNIWKQLKRIPDNYKFGENKYIRRSLKFNEQEVYDAFENEEVEMGLLDIWTNKETECTKDESSLNLFFAED